MNKVISDTAEYGCYLFDNACRPLLADFMKNRHRGNRQRPAFRRTRAYPTANWYGSTKAIRNHPVEKVGTMLRAYMTAMTSQGPRS
jgi:ketol-acid reductoisomerase